MTDLEIVKKCAWNKSHGLSKTKEFRAWHYMRQRCMNPNNTDYANYGGRGISVCERWDKFENFLKDMGEKPSPKHSLDRVNPDLGYGPNNCRWATAAEQQRTARRNNKWKIDGVLYATLVDASIATGLKRACLQWRFKSKHWPSYEVTK
jgi:hypothetical protein